MADSSQNQGAWQALDQGAWQDTSAAEEEIVAITINYNGLNLMIFSAGRQPQCQVT